MNPQKDKAEAGSGSVGALLQMFSIQKLSEFTDVLDWQVRLHSTRAKGYGHYSRRKILMDWTKRTFHQTKQMEQFLDLLKKYKEMPQIAELTKTLIDANSGFVGAFDELCQTGNRFIQTHTNPFNIDSAIHILRAKQTDRIPAVVGQSAAGSMKSLQSQVKAYAELKDIKLGANWRKGLQSQLFHRLSLIIQELESFKLILENKETHFQIMGQEFKVSFVLKPLKSLFNERLRLKIANLVHNELCPQIIGLNFDFYSSLLAHLPIQTKNELNPSSQLVKAISDSIQLKLTTQISKMIKQSYLDKRGKEPLEGVSDTASLLNESLAGSIELQPQEGLTFKTFSYLTQKLASLTSKLKSDLLRQIVACSASLPRSFIKQDESQILLLPGLEEDFKSKYTFLPLTLEIILKNQDVVFKLDHLTPLLKKNRFQISSELRMSDILKTIEELRSQEQQLNAQTEPLLVEAQQNARFSFLSKQQNPVIASLRYIAESVKTYILTELAQALQKEIQMKYWSIHEDVDSEQPKPERISFQNQILKIYLYDQEVMQVSISKRSNNNHGLNISSHIFSSNQREILRDIVCLGIEKSKCSSLLDYLSNNTFFSICEACSLEMHLTNQFKRVSQTERPCLLRQSQQLENSIQSLMDGYKSNLDNIMFS